MQFSLLGSSTNLSTKNSVESYGDVTPSAKMHLDQIASLKSENLKLMNEVIESQQTIHSLLQQVLDENKIQIQYLNNTLEQINVVGELRHRRDTGWVLELDSIFGSGFFSNEHFLLKFSGTVLEAI